MPDYISSIISDLPQLLASGGYWVLSIIVLLEGLPIIGSFFPGHIAIISAGFLVKIGVLNLTLVLLVTIIMTTMGDVLGFLIGRRYGYSFLHKFGKYIFLKEEHIEKAKRIIDRHTGKAIILGKFSPITRPLIPFIVGANGTHIKKFWTYNIIGSILWVVSSVAIGYIFGAGYHVVAGSIGRFVFVATVLAVLIIWGYRLVNTRFHVFRKYELFVLGLNLISLWALAKTIQDSFSSNSFIANFDISINLFVSKNITPFLSNLGLFISTAGSTKVTIALGLIIGIAFLLKKKYRRSAVMIFSILASSASLVLMKGIFLRTRPENAFQILHDASFPSGHAGMAAAFFVALAYVFTPQIRSWVKRELFIVACVIAIILIGLSRIVLSVHWPSDVLAGWSLGVFLATGSILLIRFLSGFLTGINKKEN
ncbi:MAG: bifunctional DedA family/phosphatase PAP2 family protein [bacterium]|nr:bifunctional DedA family/phosphatase PAP2 family protein [bacterium]